MSFTHLERRDPYEAAAFLANATVLEFDQGAAARFLPSRQVAILCEAGLR